MNVNTVCQPDCLGRSPTCHAECEKYLASWEANRRLAEQKKRDRRITEVLDNGARKAMRQMHKKQRHM